MDIKGDIENEERVNQKVHEPQEHVGHHGGVSRTSTSTISAYFLKIEIKNTWHIRDMLYTMLDIENEYQEKYIR